MDQSMQRLPTAGETVELKYLISSPHLNGKRGEISTYVSDPDRQHRYRVNIILEDGTRQIIAVNPQSISLLHSQHDSSAGSGPGSSIRGDDSFYYCQDWDIAHVLIPCHVDSERRCAQFRQCVRSLSRQVGRCRIFVCVSGPPKFREAALDTLRMAAVSFDKEMGGRHHQWVVIEEETTGADVSENEAQWQRWKSLLSASMDIQPNAWLMFLENCDMYHPLRVQFFHEKIKNMRENDIYGKAFSVGGGVLINDVMAKTMFGTDNALPVELFLNGDDSLRGVIEIASTPETNGKGDTLEYFDYCVQPHFFREFLESMSHRPTCKQGFLDALTNVTPTPPHFRHTDQNWLYVHYCCSQNGRQNG
mmetsp:Transcript_3058/g.6716  ORF Transcript_3058/g.6716 Transcript_3058/m.6716 type:complete len:362 (+) Transcript_3058:278-1363(+)